MATSVDSYDRETVFLWNIKNIRYCNIQNGKSFTSPQFSVSLFPKIKWFLEVFPNGFDKQSEDCVFCFLCKEGEGPDVIHVTSSLFINSILQPFYDENSSQFENGTRVGDKFIVFSNSEIMRQNHLTIKCWLKIINLPPSLPAISNDVLPSFQPNSRFNKYINDLRKQVDTSSPNQMLDVCPHPSKYFAQTSFVILKRFITFPVDSAIKNEFKTKLMKPVNYTDQCYGVILGTNSENADYLDVSLAYIGDKHSDFNNNNFIVAIKFNISDQKSLPLKSSQEEYIFNGLPTAQTWQIYKAFKVNDVNRKLIHSSNLTLNVELGFQIDHFSHLKYFEYNFLRMYTSNDLTDGGTSRSKILALLKEKKCCDVILQTENKAFVAHKIMLCAVSKKFSDILPPSLGERSSNIVKIRDVNEYILELMIEFIYSGEVKDLDLKNAKQLYEASLEYQMDSLKEYCREFLIDNMDVLNIYDILQFVSKHSDKVIINGTIEFITIYKSTVLTSQQWLSFIEENLGLAEDILRNVCIKL